MSQRNKPETKNKILFQILVFVAFLIGVLVCVLIHTESAKKTINKAILKDITDIASGYADTVDDAITRAFDQSYVVSNSIRDTGNPNVDEMMDASLLGLFTHMYAVAESGQGVSEKGNEVDLSGCTYWNNIDYKRNRQVLMEENSDGGNDIVTVTTVKTSQNGTWYVITTVPTTIFTDKIKKTEFDGLTLYMLTDCNGEILVSNKSSSVLDDESNLWNAPIDDSVTAKRLKSVMAEGGTGGEMLTCKNETRYLTISPVAKGDLSVVIAVTNSYINWEFDKKFDSFSKLKSEVILLVLAYLILQTVASVSAAFRSKRETKQLEEKADTDLLTGLNNKLATERKIKEYIEGHPDTPCMMLLFDIDKFKKINDTKGHAFGDEVLRTLGETITAQFRVTDIIGRVGGDEFMVFLKNISSDEIQEKEAVKLINYFRNFQAGGYVKYSATASAGVAMYPADGDSFEKLYKAADEALYRSKENGRNQLNFYDKTKETVHG